VQLLFIDTSIAVLWKQQKGWLHHHRHRHRPPPLRMVTAGVAD
jgi:hypothetical protein